MVDQPLHCLICGYERGGTTLLSELIRQHARIDGRFECGFLLGRRPGDYIHMQPYVDNLKTAWRVDDRGLEYICASDSWMEMYRRLREVSILPDKTVSLYDKTPRYMEFLKEVMAKVPVPCVVIVRDPRAVYHSHRRHGPTQIGPFCGYYINYARAFNQARQAYPSRLLLVRYERLCVNPQQEAERIFDFLGLEFDPAYLSLSRRADEYVSLGINTQAISAYSAQLSPAEQQEILTRTREFSDWHWLES